MSAAISKLRKKTYIFHSEESGLLDIKFENVVKLRLTDELRHWLLCAS